MVDERESTRLLVSSMMRIQRAQAFLRQDQHLEALEMEKKAILRCTHEISNDPFKKINIETKKQRKREVVGVGRKREKERERKSRIEPPQPYKHAIPNVIAAS